MERLVYIVFTIMFSACLDAQQTKVVQESQFIDSLKINAFIKIKESVGKEGFDSVQCGLNFKPEKDYKVEKHEINKIRNELNIRYLNTNDISIKNKILDSSKMIFTELLLNNIIPFWYGTPWDFNGYTAIPNQGTVACGYFVSTTLRDMGLNVNRYSLAQQGPENEAKSIAISKSEMLHFENENINKELYNLDKGLYFIGLDNHVGYLYINRHNTYFIHSNYIEGKVMIEESENSEAFYSTNYYISKITGNNHLIEKWLKKEEINVIKG